VKASRVFPLLVGTLLLNGCLAGRINNQMNSWMGHNYSELIMSWGPPQRVYDDGQGGRILIYTSIREWTTPGNSTTETTGQATINDKTISGQAHSVTTYTPPETWAYTAYRMFAINKNGRIYKYSWRGL
jgi:hypothetical protein